MSLFWFGSGLALLIGGAELVVRGAVYLSSRLGISPLVIGLTVVAYGTSAPELAVGVRAAWLGSADLALGNIIGSNIFNVLFILGLSAIITPLVVQQQLVRLDVPLMIGVSILLLVLALDGGISQLDGVLLFAGLIAYTIFIIRESRRQRRSKQAEYELEYGQGRLIGRLPVQILLVLVGIGLLVLGARWLVDGSVTIARSAGISEAVIGLTLIAIGTSLPEVATSIVAAVRGQRDIAVGNIVGSNISNILAVVGLTAAVNPGGLRVAESLLHFDLPVMMAVAVACLPIFAMEYRISRWEGVVFFSYYVIYMVYLVLDTIHHPLLAVYSTDLLRYVLPLTLVVLLAVLMKSMCDQPPAAPAESPPPPDKPV